MANQKEFKIIINGVKESIEGIGTLQDSLDKLGKKVEESGSHMTTASKSMDELAKTEQKIKQYNEEYATALAANKAVLADHNKEVKAKLDLEKAEITVQENLRDTYAQKQQLLTAMGKVIKNTTGDTSELKAQYASLNQELKDFDAELGNHQRNVGDYKIATRDLKGELKELQTSMAVMLADGVDKADPKFVELAQKAGALKDAIGDAGEEIKRFASDTKTLDDVINVAQSATAAFTLYKGAMSAFGIETEGAVEAIQKLQGAMSIIQSLQTLQNTLQQNTATAKIFTKTMNLMTLGIEGTTKATKLLKIGLASIGIGLIIGLVATLIEYWDDIKKTFKDTFPILGTLSDKFNGLTGIIRGVGQAIVHFLTNPIVTFAKVIKKLFQGDFKGAVDEAVNGLKNQFTGLKNSFFKGVEKSREKVETETKKAGKAVVKTAKEVADTRKQLLDDVKKYELDAIKTVDKEREDAAKKEEQRLERLKKLRRDNQSAENNYQKQLLKLELQNAKTDEEKLKVKEKIIALDEKIAIEEKKIAAADALGISIEELNSRLANTEATYMGLNDEGKQVMQTLITQIATLKMGAEEARNALSGATGGSTSGKTGGKSGGNRFMDFEGNGGVNWGEIGDTIRDAYDAYAAPIVEGLGDSIRMMMEFAIEEAENALEEAETMHDEAVEKVETSKDKISDLNDKLKESSGAQLDAYKQQMADEMQLLVQREAEEKRLAKEKEKREKELEKQKKKARKLELQQQLIQAIVSGALAVVNGLATQPFLPVGIAMGAVAAAATAIQIATITKQMSKLAEGGLLTGPSHSRGGIPVGNTGVEVEGGEYVVNKRSTRKYLPLLQQINEEGARKKTVANQLGKMANGGQLNYQKISTNADALTSTKILQSTIEGININPIVSVVDINRAQKNYTSVRQMAGASK